LDRVQLHLLWIKVILNVSTGHFWGEMIGNPVQSLNFFSKGVPKKIKNKKEITYKYQKTLNLPPLVFY